MSDSASCAFTLVPLINSDLPCIVDEQDADLVIQFEWRAQWHYKRQSTAYAVAGQSPWLIRMHRLIMNPPAHLEIDHRNGDGLCNIRSNLRMCTHAENSRNRKPNVGHLIKGVYWDSGRSLWRAQINVAGKKIRLGRFNTITEAASAYNAAALRLHGEFAQINHLQELASLR